MTNRGGDKSGFGTMTLDEWRKLNMRDDEFYKSGTYPLNKAPLADTPSASLEDLTKLVELASAHGFKLFDSDLIGAYYERPEGSIIGIYRDGGWSYKSADGKLAKGSQKEVQSLLDILSGNPFASAGPDEGAV